MLCHAVARAPPSQTWRTFIENDLNQSIAIAFAVVPTFRFSLLYVFVILDHRGGLPLVSSQFKLFLSLILYLLIADVRTDRLFI